jgi:hypothetical protein
VFKVKHGVNGEVERYKAKLVARGFTQKFGVDYNETFAPVAKFVSIRCILALAAIEYVAQVEDVKFFIVVYVDDFILVCNNNLLLQVKDLGDLHFFLGMEVERDCARLLYINQIEYLKEILKCCCMEDCKAIGVPLDPKTKLKKNVNKDNEMVKVPYHQAVGSLMYAMLCTRPDLAYPISVVILLANSSLEHWIAMKCIFRYLQGRLQFTLRRIITSRLLEITKVICFKSYNYKTMACNI